MEYPIFAAAENELIYGGCRYSRRLLLREDGSLVRAEEYPPPWVYRRVSADQATPLELSMLRERRGQILGRPAWAGSPPEAR